MFGLMQNPAGSKQFAPLSDEWSRALTEALEIEDVVERNKRLAEWRKFPHAYQMHPDGGAEHFLPLLVTAGSAGQEDGKVKKYKDTFVGVGVWTYYWGDVEV
jgi:aromatic ring-opening dioxygenase catalytic subunit (LigB family)